MAEKEPLAGFSCFKASSQLGGRRTGLSLKKGSWLTTQLERGFGRVAVADLTGIPQPCVRVRTDGGATATLHYRTQLRGSTGKSTASDSLGHDVMVMRNRSFGYERVVSVELIEQEECLVVACGGESFAVGDSTAALIFIGPCV